jgi:hypothetical protein
MSARDKFIGIKADFWDCADAERLTHLDPVSALESVVDCHRGHGHTTEETIREMGEIIVEAYRRAVHPPTDIDDATDRALDAAREMLDDETELGDPEGERPMFSIDVLAKHRPAFDAAVRALAADAKVWHCDLIQSVELTPDDALEILRVERPEWFEPPTTAGALLPEDL